MNFNLTAMKKKIAVYQDAVLFHTMLLKFKDFQPLYLNINIHFLYIPF